MSRVLCLTAALLLSIPQWAAAQMLPHRAEYALRLGVAPNAPRIGTAVQDITLDCTGWHIKRDVTSEIALTSSWKFSVASKLDGKEGRGGSGFQYRTVQIQNGSERDTKGDIKRSGKELRAEIVSPNGPLQFVLPSPTLMPVAAISHMVDQLKAKASSFPTLMFDAEVVGDAFLVDVNELDADALRPAPAAEKPVAVPASQAWPVFMTFTRGRNQDQRPLFSVSAKMFDNGVLDRLTVDTGLFKIAADLETLEMHKAPTCPGS